MVVQLHQKLLLSVRKAPGSRDQQGPQQQTHPETSSPQWAAWEGGVPPEPGAPRRSSILSSLWGRGPLQFREAPEVHDGEPNPEGCFLKCESSSVSSSTVPLSSEHVSISGSGLSEPRNLPLSTLPTPPDVKWILSEMSCKLLASMYQSHLLFGPYQLYCLFVLLQPCFLFHGFLTLKICCLLVQQDLLPFLSS